jgi:hypothetical protein
MVYVQLGEERRAEKGLRRDPPEQPEHKVRFGAAYNLAVSQRKQGAIPAPTSTPRWR